MRQVLIDFARAQEAAKRGCRCVHVDLSYARKLAAIQAAPGDRLDLTAALGELATLNCRQAHIVKLRYFDGLNNAEIAGLIGISEPTVVREWRVARAWLFHRLDPKGSHKHSRG